MRPGRKSRSRRGTLARVQSTMEFVDCFYCGKIAHTNVWDETLVYVCWRCSEEDYRGHPLEFYVKRRDKEGSIDRLNG